MSFGKFMFLAGFTQKTIKEDLNIKRDRGIISWLLRRNILEDTRGHHAEAGHETLLGGAIRPHPRPPRLPRWEMPTSFQSLPPLSS
jgi:hypothetical protein